MSNQNPKASAAFLPDTEVTGAHSTFPRHTTGITEKELKAHRERTKEERSQHLIKVAGGQRFLDERSKYEENVKK